MEAINKLEKGFVQFAMTVTFSKFIALMILILSFVMDYHNNKGGTVFMFSLPFVVFLVTGKQIIDYKQKVETNTTEK
jgi:hypothetical protein